MATQKHLPFDDRKAKLVAAALRVAARDGYAKMTREAVAKAADSSPALVSRYLGTMPNLRRVVMRQAVQQGIVTIVAQGLAARDPQALKAPEALRKNAARSLATA